MNKSFINPHGELSAGKRDKIASIQESLDERGLSTPNVVYHIDMMLCDPMTQDQLVSLHYLIEAVSNQERTDGQTTPRHRA